MNASVDDSVTSTPATNKSYIQPSPATPNSPLSVRKCPQTPQLKLVVPLKPISPFFLTSKLHHLLVFPSKSRSHSWPNQTPECARGLQWDTVLDYRTPGMRDRWDNVSPLRGSPARRLFSWAFEGQLDVSLPVVENDVFPLKDLDNDVIHDLTAKEYEFLPPTL